MSSRCLSQMEKQPALQGQTDLWGTRPRSPDPAAHLCPCLEVNVQCVPIQGHKVRRDTQLVQKFALYRQGEGRLVLAPSPGTRLLTWGPSP